jgi:hypothetical protein
MTIKIIKKYSYEGNDYFLRSITELIVNEIQEKAGDDAEAVMFGFWDAMLCDEKGELLNLSEDDIKATYPMDMRVHMCQSMTAQATGQKKS